MTIDVRPVNGLPTKGTVALLRYLDDDIDVNEFERTIGDLVLTGQLDTPFMPPPSWCSSPRRAQQELR